MTWRDLLVPFMLHLGLVAGLYAWLTVARAFAVRSGQANYSDFRRADGDPPSVAPIARNLANQFELPTVAWFSASILVLADAVGVADVAAAWVFFVGRVIHTAVQTFTSNVPLRGLVFLINALGVAWLAGHVAWLAFFTSGR